MNGYRLLEHTADMGVEAWAGSPEELFRQMALGLRQIITGCPEIRPAAELVVSVRGGDREELLVNWLGELVYLLEARNFIAAEVVIETWGETGLSARVRGEEFDPVRHYLEREIKAVTYHQVEVRNGPQGWTARVYVDL